MGYKVKNTDFFKQKMPDTEIRSGTDPSGSGQGKLPEADRPEGVQDTVRAEPLRLSEHVKNAVSGCCTALKGADLPELAKEVDTVCRSAVHERFTVAVVGQFDRGKSTFINRFLNKEFLPVGDLPTTAVLTRIRYHSKEVLIAFDENNKKVLERPLSQEAWEGLVAENFGGEDFKGTVLAGVDVKWLQESNVELMDTPGAGDLSDARAKVIGDALLQCDGAVIAVNANAPLSLSEKLFIEERLLARKIPFLMLIITKLDQIPLAERADMIRYIRGKLKGWKMDIPVYVPYPVELSEDGFADMIGMDKVKREIAGWITYPERVSLTEQWILAKTETVMKNAISFLTEQKLLLEAADNEKREELIRTKRDQLARARLAWGELRIQMEKRCTECYELLLDKVDGYAESITERLQYEASHAGNAQKWWTEDYPYRLKVELTNMSVGVENIVSKRISEDARWYAGAIEKSFHSHVLFQKESISDKELFGDFRAGRELVFEDLDKQRAAVRIGSAVLSISGVVLFSAMGFMPIIATMGVGTGTTLISDKVFKKKIEQQKEELKAEIARSVPAFIQGCMAESEKRLTTVYRNIIAEAEKSEQEWLETQEAAVRAVQASGDGGRYEAIEKKLAMLEREAETLSAV